MSGITEHLYDENGLDGEAITPDLDDVMQEEYTGPAVPVRLSGPVTVNELPTRDAVSKNITVSDTTNPPEMIVSEDLRRKFLYITITGQPCYVGFDKQSVMNGTAAILPVGMLIPLPTAMPVWVRAATAGNSVVSYWAGTWAD